MRWAPGIMFALAVTAAGTDSEGGRIIHSSRISRPTSPSGYFYSIRALHTPKAGQQAPLDESGRPELVLWSANLNVSEAFAATSDGGGFHAADLQRAAHILREASTGHEFPVEPRLLDALYRIQRRFKAQEIRVLSAYRTPVEGNGQGNHGRGRAADFVVPGADDLRVARFAHELGFVGVGLYPVGSFIHVDVRPQSYFWIDRSGPGHTSQELAVFPDVAASSDAKALARGEAPPTFGIGDDGVPDEE